MATAAATQLAIPGALVGVVSPAVGAPVCDRTVWQRAVLRASLSSAAKLVALALASHTTPADGGYAACSPGLATLVTETGYSRTLVQRQISTLRTRGWLAAVDRPASGRPARFVLSLPEPVARAHGVPTSPAAAAASSDLPAAPGVPASPPPSQLPQPSLLQAAPAPPADPAPEAPPAPAGGPAVAGGADAAWQILATFARAMRCGQEDFGDAAARLTAVLDSGSWSPAALATHLVDFLVGGVRVAGADPADSLGWRLDRLPASDRDCACRSCRSWQQRPAASASAPVRRPASFASPRAGAGSRAAPAASAAPAAASAPEFAAIEQAAAAGAARARMRATGAA